MISFQSFSYTHEERDWKEVLRAANEISADAAWRLRIRMVDLMHVAYALELFERRWALSLLSAVFDRLANDYTAAGKGELFQVVQGFLSPGSDVANYATAARHLNMTEGAVRMAVHRLRRRYGQLFQEEVAHTVANAAEIEDEMRQLRRILSV